MDVPVQPRAGAEGWVDAREELARQVGGDVAADGVVDEGGEEELVDVEGEGGEGERIGEGGREADEGWGRGDGEWVVHGFWGGIWGARGGEAGQSGFGRGRYRGIVLDCVADGKECVGEEVQGGGSSNNDSNDSRQQCQIRSVETEMSRDRNQTL